MVSVVIDDVVNFVWKTVKLLSKFVEVNESNTFNLSENFILLVLEVILEDNVVSQERLINSKGW